jgi:hemerythrin superfamily protein
MARVSRQLIDDHAALDKVLKQLQTALCETDLELARDKLDLFWARLAVHIRAEHLHLFPAVLSKAATSDAPTLDEAQAVVSQLRQDHDFFMWELALAVEIMRELLTLPNQLIVPEGLNNIKKILLEVEQRLVKHNELEENQVYCWAKTLLNSEEQAKLAKLITTDLQKRPSRFTLDSWSNE